MSCGKPLGISGFQRPGALPVEGQSPLSPPRLLLADGCLYVPLGQ
jgi:hypothetical protein